MTAVFAVMYVMEGREPTSAEPVHYLRRLKDEDANCFYIGARPPLKQNARMKLSIGSMRPEGWLRQQLQLDEDGFTGHLTEVSKFFNFQRSAWTIRVARERLVGRKPYWLKGFVHLGYVLRDERIIDLWPNMIMMYPLRTYYEV